MFAQNFCLLKTGVMKVYGFFILFFWDVLTISIFFTNFSETFLPVLKKGYQFFLMILSEIMGSIRKTGCEKLICIPDKKFMALEKAKRLIF